LSAEVVVDENHKKRVVMLLIKEERQVGGRSFFATGIEGGKENSLADNFSGAR
jgi:hypothetical protein